MKKAFLLLFCCACALCACQKTPEPETPSKDADLSGTPVNLEPFANAAKKIFVLNEGGLGSNNATLDMLRFSDSQYITGVFKKMNPGIGAGLGDVGNDIAVRQDEVWIVVNNSGIVEILSAKDETEIATVAVPTPRGIAFDDKYAYVTSWAGAFATYGQDYSITDYDNPKGQVYRIDLSTKKLAGSVEVGYQPEGIACYGGKLYVANSGGLTLPPAYAYDNTVSIIDAASFTVSRTVEVQVNLKNVYASSQGIIYVTSLGNYYDIHSGLYAFPAGNPSGVIRVQGIYKDEATHVTSSCQSGDTVYCLGTEAEFDWSALRQYYVWSVDKETITAYPFSLSGTPYGLYVLEDNSGLQYLLLGDAGDYFNPGTLSCYRLGHNQNEKIWSVTAGVCPGHFAVWK